MNRNTCTRLPVDPASIITAYVCAFEFADSITNENKPKHATKIATERSFTWKGDIKDGMVLVRKCITISGKDWFFSSPNGFFLFFIFIASDDDEVNEEEEMGTPNSMLMFLFSSPSFVVDIFSMV